MEGYTTSSKNLVLNLSLFTGYARDVFCTRMSNMLMICKTSLSRSHNTKQTQWEHPTYGTVSRVEGGRLYF